jgi:transposase
VGERKAYKTDLTDAEWVVIEPLIAAWKARHPSVSGHQGRHEIREIVNALRYQNRTGCHSHNLVPGSRPPRRSGLLIQAGAQKSRSFACLPV